MEKRKKKVVYIFARVIEVFLLPSKNTRADKSILFKILTRQRAKKSTFGSKQAQNTKGERTKEKAAGNT